MDSIAELKNSIIERCFPSPLIRDHLKAKEIKPQVLALLVITSTLLLEEKRSIILQLMEVEECAENSALMAYFLKAEEALSCLKNYKTALNSIEGNIDGLWELKCLRDRYSSEHPRLENQDDYAIALVFEGSEMGVKGETKSFAEIIDEMMEEEESLGIVLDDELDFFSSMGLDDLIFGEDDSILLEMHSLFADIFQLGTILELNFEPFYEKCYGLVLSELAVEEDPTCKRPYYQSENVLVRTDYGWQCGELAWRDVLFKCLDPIGPYFNSYARVKEVWTHVDPLDDSRCCGDDEVLNILSFLQELVERKPAVADAIISALNAKDYSGMDDLELLEFCTCCEETMCDNDKNDYTPIGEIDAVVITDDVSTFVSGKLESINTRCSTFSDFSIEQIKQLAEDNEAIKTLKPDDQDDLSLLIDICLAGESNCNKLTLQQRQAVEDILSKNATNDNDYEIDSLVLIEKLHRIIPHSYGLLWDTSLDTQIAKEQVWQILQNLTAEDFKSQISSKDCKTLGSQIYVAKPRQGMVFQDSTQEAKLHMRVVNGYSGKSNFVVISFHKDETTEL